MSMEDALVAFINEAKLAADQDSKLYALNQIRELVLHRAPALLDRGLQELAEFQVERAAQIRRFLINLYRDVCEKDPKHAALTINMFDYFSYDTNDNLVRDLINASVKLFPTIMRLFVQPHALPQSEEIWSRWRQLLLRMIGFIDSEKGPQARKAAMRLLEVYAMFALPDDVESVAPADRSGVNISKFPSDHPFVQLADIKDEAEGALGRLLLWIQRGGTKARAFDHGLYAQSIEVVCSVALRRPAHFTQVANVLTHFLDHKQDLQPQIKETAARTSAKLVVAAERTALQQDIEASLAGQKLEVALASQGFGAVVASAREAAGAQPRHVAEAQDPRKRKRDVAQPPVPEPVDAKKSRDEMRSSAAPLSTEQSTQAQARGASVPTATAAGAAQAQVKMGEVIMQANDWQVKPLEVDAQTYKAAGRSALLRFLSSITTAEQLGFSSMFCSWSTKMAVTMASLESSTESGVSQTMALRLPAPQVPVPDALEMKEGDTPQNKFLAAKLYLPTSLADTADFCIDTVARNEMQGEAEGSLAQVTQIALDLLTRLFDTVARPGEQGDAEWDVYDTMLAHTLIKFRALPSIPAEVGSTLLCRLPRVPKDALELFKVSALSDSKRSREWGMKLLRDLTVFCEDISQQCLNALLWFATNSDFELRIKSVHICHELCEEEALREHITMFALQAVIALVGTKLLEWRRLQLGDKLAEMAEFDSLQPGQPATEEAENEPAADQAGDQVVDQAGQQVVEQAGEQVDAEQREGEQPMEMGANDDTQQEDNQGDSEDVVPPYTFSLLNPANLEAYARSAAVFEGDFLAEGEFEPTGGVEVGSETDVKRRIQLICNLTLMEPHMIVALRDASATVQASIDTMADDQPAVASNESAAAWSKAKVEHADAFLERQRAITHAISSEVQNIVPAIARALGAVRLFNILRNGDRGGHALLLTVLRSLTADDHVPPASDLVNAVLELVESDVPSLDGFLVPIVGGLSGAMVENLLPRLISLGAEATEEVLRRLIRVRPVPISRKDLLCALHRIDHDAQNVKLKAVREAIELCLSNRNDFRSDIIQEALETMSQDPIPPLMLMRTVILACQAYPELKRATLRTILPRLLERKVWDTSPKLWEGFVVCVKQLANHRDAGDLLHKLLRIPYDTLRSLVKVASTVEEPLARIVSRMSDRELEEAVAPPAPNEDEAQSSTTDNAQEATGDTQDKASKIRKLVQSDSKSRIR